MRKRLLAIALTGLGAAQAEDQPEESLRARSLRPEREGPWLHLDEALLAPRLEPFDASRDSQATSLALGPHTRAAVQGTWWSAESDMRPDGGPGAREVTGHGWGAGMQLSHDFGPVRVTVGGSVNRVDTRFGRGTYTDVGIAIERTVRLSRWMTGWISLGIGRRRWDRHVPPPPGEANGLQGMLTIGTTFR